MRAQCKGEWGRYYLERAGGDIFEQDPIVEKRHVRDGAIRVGKPCSNVNGIGIAEDRAVWRISDRHADRARVLRADGYIHDTGSGEEAIVIGSDCGKRVAAGGEGGRNGIRRVIGLPRHPRCRYGPLFSDTTLP